ncbi:trypsin-like peptidase domain-containing protein [Aliiglaciecola sp.]|nr:trypsin-like peptidase domain-containing protein [Aliiglaciecola sp.]
MKLSSLLQFVGKSIALGLIISALILVLVPELRHGSGLSFDVFGRSNGLPEKISYYDAISRSAPAVVNIYSSSTDIVRRRQVSRTSLGSGVIMNQSGYIVTCWHVIKDAESTIVGLPDGRTLEGNLVGYDELTDLAVLKIEADNLHVIPQTEQPEVRAGDVVLAIGNPLNIGQTITQGIVSRSGHTVTLNFRELIQTDAVLHQGNSGGALVDSNGTLIGINNANFKTLDEQRRVVDVNGIFFALPYSLARRVMDEIIENGRATHGQLGFSGGIDPNIEGVVITDVVSGGPSDLAGLKQFDIILSMDGVSLISLDQTFDMITKSRPGQQIELSISRGGTIINVSVTVGEATR